MLESFHASIYGGHDGGERISHKVLLSGFFWNSLFTISIALVKGCNKFDRLGTISRQHEMSLNDILVLEIFYVWGIDFMGPFPSSSVNHNILESMDF